MKSPSLLNIKDSKNNIRKENTEIETIFTEAKDSRRTTGAQKRRTKEKIEEKYRERCSKEILRGAFHNEG